MLAAEGEHGARLAQEVERTAQQLKEQHRSEIAHDRAERLAAESALRDLETRFNLLLAEARARAAGARPPSSPPASPPNLVDAAMRLGGNSLEANLALYSAGHTLPAGIAAR